MQLGKTYRASNERTRNKSIDFLHRSVPNIKASKTLFRGHEDDDEDMFAIDQSPLEKKESETELPDLFISRVRNFCDEPLLVRILKPANKVRFFQLGGKNNVAEPEELVVKGADAVGLDLEKKVRWQRTKERQVVVEVKKLKSLFRYLIIAEGNYLGYEKVRTIVQKNGAG